jgi:stage V sporulation protein G
VFLINEGKVVKRLNITDVRIRKINTEGKMKAIVSVTFDDEFVVHDIKVIEGQSGLFIAMPSRKTPNGEYKDIAHPINAETRGMIQKSILEKYQEMIAEVEV